MTTDPISAAREALEPFAAMPCETTGAEDLEPGCCKTCRARAALSSLPAAAGSGDGELKACPFCEGAASDHSVCHYLVETGLDEETGVVGCSACDVWFHAPTRQEAIEQWNRRPVPPSEGGELATKLRELDAKATPGPWYHCLPFQSAPKTRTIHGPVPAQRVDYVSTWPDKGTPPGHKVVIPTGGRETTASSDDMALIAFLRTHVPAIIPALSTAEDCGRLRNLNGTQAYRIAMLEAQIGPEQERRIAAEAERDKWKERAADRCDEAHRWAERKWAEQARADKAEADLAACREQIAGAREAALEEAAKVVDGFNAGAISCDEAFERGYIEAVKQFATAIRALKGGAA